MQATKEQICLVATVNGKNHSYITSHETDST